MDAVSLFRRPVTAHASAFCSRLSGFPLLRGCGVFMRLALGWVKRLAGEWELKEDPSLPLSERNECRVSKFSFWVTKIRDRERKESKCIWGSGPEVCWGRSVWLGLAASRVSLALSAASAVRMAPQTAFPTASFSGFHSEFAQSPRAGACFPEQLFHYGNMEQKMRLYYEPMAERFPRQQPPRLSKPQP